MEGILKITDITNKLLEKTINGQIDWLRTDTQYIAHGEHCTFLINGIHSELSIRVDGKEKKFGCAFELHKLLWEKLGGLKPSPVKEEEMKRKESELREFVNAAVKELSEKNP